MAGRDLCHAERLDGRVGHGTDLDTTTRRRERDSGVSAVLGVQRELHHRNGLVEAIGIMQLDSQPGEGVSIQRRSRIRRNHQSFRYRRTPDVRGRQPHIMPRTGRERGR
jgi:hypothetical protein